MVGSFLIHRFIVVIQELAAYLTALQHFGQPFDLLQRAGLGNGIADFLDISGVGLDLWLVGVLAGICHTESCLLLDLFLNFFSLCALEEYGCFLSLLLLDFLEVQQAKIG